MNHTCTGVTSHLMFRFCEPYETYAFSVGMIRFYEHTCPMYFTVHVLLCEPFTLLVFLNLWFGSMSVLTPCTTNQIIRSMGLIPFFNQSPECNSVLSSISIRECRGQILTISHPYLLYVLVSFQQVTHLIRSWNSLPSSYHGFADFISSQWTSFSQNRFDLSMKLSRLTFYFRQEIPSLVALCMESLPKTEPIQGLPLETVRSCAKFL